MSKDLLKLKNLEVLAEDNSRNLIVNPVTHEEQYSCKHDKRYEKVYLEFRNDRPFGINLKRRWLYIESYCIECRGLVSRISL